MRLPLPTVISDFRSRPDLSLSEEPRRVCRVGANLAPCFKCAIPSLGWPFYTVAVLSYDKVPECPLSSNRGLFPAVLRSPSNSLPTKRRQALLDVLHECPKAWETLGNHEKETLGKLFGAVAGYKDGMDEVGICRRHCGFSRHSTWELNLRKCSFGEGTMQISHRARQLSINRKW
jgi:hypothetical protein